jgi:hypothetical protein
MRGVIPPPQYAFMGWCSVKKSTGTTLPLHFLPFYLQFCKNPRMGAGSWPLARFVSTQDSRGKFEHTAKPCFEQYSNPRFEEIERLRSVRDTDRTNISSPTEIRSRKFSQCTPLQMYGHWIGQLMNFKIWPLAMQRLCFWLTKKILPQQLVVICLTKRISLSCNIYSRSQ